MNCLLTNLFCSGFEPQQYHSDLTRSWHIQFCLILVHTHTCIITCSRLVDFLCLTPFSHKFFVSSFLRFSCASSLSFIIHFSSKGSFSCWGSYSQCWSSANERNDSHERACLLSYVFHQSNHEVTVPKAFDCWNQVMKGCLEPMQVCRSANWLVCELLGEWRAWVREKVCTKIFILLEQNHQSLQLLNPYRDSLYPGRFMLGVNVLL